MTYKIVIYCPDRHILYTAGTPEKKGVGGGVTARIRLGQELAALGHDVTIISHVPKKHTSRGVTFLPLSEAKTSRKADVLVITTSGDKISVRPAQHLKVQAQLREVWVHGTVPVNGLDVVEHDYLITVSNFIRKWAHEDWGVPLEKIFVACNGVTHFPTKRGLFRRQVQRDPYSLIYFSHPSKGLQAAISVLRILREKDQRFHLHVYGGAALWGGVDQQPEPEPGVVYHGMVGQQDVARALQQVNISMHLQARLEPFALALVEAMGYGAIPIVSPLGGNREAVRDGYNGFWVEGDHESPEVHQRAAGIILRLAASTGFSDYIRGNAQNIPWNWTNQARVWSEHWSWELDRKGTTINTPESHCPECSGRWLLTADGYHCLNCGYYSLDGN